MRLQAIEEDVRAKDHMISEDTKNYSEAVKNIVLAISIVIGGCWALYTFNATLEIKNAEAKLEKLKNDLVKKPVLESAINYTSKESLNSCSWILEVTVEISNLGNTDVQIGLNNESLRVAKVMFENGIIGGYKKPVYTHEKSIPGKESSYLYHHANAITVLAGQKKTLNFLLDVNETGIYQVDFIAKPGKTLVEARERSSEIASKISVVSTQTYAYVGYPNNVLQRTSR